MIDLERLAVQRAQEQLDDGAWRFGRGEHKRDMCSGPECTKAAFCRGLCRHHYEQARKGGRLAPSSRRRADRDTIAKARAELAARGIHVSEAA